MDRIKLKLEPILMRRVQVADLLGVCTRTIRRWEQAGRLPCIKIGNAIRYRALDVKKLVEERHYLKRL
jgi:excisionase family DNA binding protein